MFPPLRQIPPRLCHGCRAALPLLTTRSGLIICALFLLVGLVSAGNYGLGADEATQRLIAETNLNYILGRGDGIPPFKTSANPLVPSDRYYGVAFELPLLLSERALGLEDFHYVNRLRLTLTHLFFIVGAFFCYRLAGRLFDNRLIALFALLIFLLHPRIYGHSLVNSKDLPFLSMFVITLYLLERAFRRDTVGAFVLLGAAVGLLTNLRIMGIMLFAAVIAMRGLDWFQVGSGPERKRILLTAGLFVLAAALTLYAITPYAWNDPIAYLAGSLNLTANHPTVVSVLFQGELIPSDQLPARYLPTWFAIATPPLFLLLLGLGAAAAIAGGIRRPAAIFRNNGLRFQLLLLACFLLPPLAAILLGSNQYDDWRHLYFLYGPGCLLAAGGLHGLTAGLSRQGRGRAGMYGLTGLGLGLLLLQMVQLHPLQYSYFNFLVDRTTPEYLRTQYAMDYFKLARTAALRYLLESQPGATWIVRGEDNRLREGLPPGLRPRLQLAGGGRNADYELVSPLDASQPDLPVNSAYPRRFYNNSLAALRPLADSRMTAAARAAYREFYRQAVAGPPLIPGNYALYLNGQRLTLIQENCPEERQDVRFTVKFFPRRLESRPLPLWDQEAYWQGYNHRVRLGEVCIAVLQLPVPVEGDLILSLHSLSKLQRVHRLLWEELYSSYRPGLGELVAEWRESQPTAAGPEGFAVILHRAADGKQALIYDRADCSWAEYETPVFLHIYPENLADLPFYRWAEGKENRDFPLSRYGVRPGGDCLAVVPLPDYPVAALRTGQEDSWEVNLYPATAPERLRAARAALAGRPPAARSVFDLYLRDNRLVYGRESCAAGDTAAGFFLHIVPEDAAVLPAERRAAGFDNWDFPFDRWGGHFDGQCLAAVPLPGYPIAAIRTGQAGIWAVDLYPPADPGRLAAVAETLAKREPAARGVFDLYLRHNRLIYLRESCAAADTAAGFLLHIIPRNGADLPPERQGDGFANQDFAFEHWGAHFDGKCLASVPLPDYPVKAIRTGQQLPGGGELWVVYLPVE